MPHSNPSPPQVGLKALTPEAREALGGLVISIKSFPFRVGRERRLRDRLRRILSIDRRQESKPPTNDLYLPDPEEPHNLSPKHFTINSIGGVLFVEDVGSDLGMLVEGVPVGRRRLARKAKLHHADVIIAGGSRSPFVFKFLASFTKSLLGNEIEAKN